MCARSGEASSLIASELDDALVDDDYDDDDDVDDVDDNDRSGGDWAPSVRRRPR